MEAPNAVCFERTSGLATSPLVFRDRVNPELVACSSVLSCIAESGGEAKLPDSITASEFRAWASAVEFETGNKILSPSSISRICIVAKVGDALDDKFTWLWVLQAGSAIVSLLSHWKDSHTPDVRCDKASIQQEIEPIFGLPIHLQLQILSKAITLAAAQPHLPSQESGPFLNCLFDVLKPQHHATVLQAALQVHEGGALPVNLSHSLIKALAELPPPSRPLVKALDVLQVLTRDTKYIREVLREYTSLTSLRFLDQHNGRVWALNEASIQFVEPALISLTSLQSLVLETTFHEYQAYCLLRISIIVSSLPSLQQLSISIDLNQGGYKRSRDADGPPKSPSMNDVLSSATSLTSLCIATVTPNTDGVLWFSGPLSLPSLGSLTIRSFCLNTASLLLNNITAPLTSLVLRPEAYQTEEGNVEEDLPLFMQPFAALTQLKTLSVADQRYRAYARWPGRFLTAALQPDSPAHPIMQNVENLQLRVDTDVLEGVAPRLAADGMLPNLQHLSLIVMNTLAGGPSNAVGPLTWEYMTEALAKLPVSDFSFAGSHDHVNWHREWLAVSDLHLTRFQGMTQLKLYHIRDTLAADQQVLKQLTNVKRLTIESGDFGGSFRGRGHSAANFHPNATEHGPHAGLMCIASLPQLTYLALGSVQGTQALANACEHIHQNTKQLQQVVVDNFGKDCVVNFWPALCEVHCALEDGLPDAELREAVTSICRIPSVNKIVVCLDHTDMRDEQGYDDDAENDDRMRVVSEMLAYSANSAGAEYAIDQQKMDEQHLIRDDLM